MYNNFSLSETLHNNAICLSSELETVVHIKNGDSEMVFEDFGKILRHHFAYTQMTLKNQSVIMNIFNWIYVWYDNGLMI